MFKAINIGSNVLKFIIAIVGCALAAYAALTWDAKAENVDDITPYISAAFIIAAVVTVIAFVLAILFGVFKFVSGIQKNIPMLIGIVAFFGILAFAWFGLSSWGVEEYAAYKGGKYTDPEVEHGLTQFLLQLSDGGVWAIFILVPLTIVITLVENSLDFLNNL